MSDRQETIDQLRFFYINNNGIEKQQQQQNCQVVVVSSRIHQDPNHNNNNKEGTTSTNTTTTNNTILNTTSRPHHHHQGPLEHGPFAGAGYFQDLVVVSQAQSAFVGKPRSSSALVDCVMEYNRRMRHIRRRRRRSPPPPPPWGWLWWSPTTTTTTTSNTMEPLHRCYIGRGVSKKDRNWQRIRNYRDWILLQLWIPMTIAIVLLVGMMMGCCWFVRVLATTRTTTRTILRGGMRNRGCLFHDENAICMCVYIYVCVVSIYLSIYIYIYGKERRDFHVCSLSLSLSIYIYLGRGQRLWREEGGEGVLEGCLFVPNCFLQNTVAVNFSRSRLPERYEYACKVFHKLSKFRSLSSAQNCLLSLAQIYLILTMPRDRSLVFDWFVRYPFLVFDWFVQIFFLVFHWLIWDVLLCHSFPCESGRGLDSHRDPALRADFALQPQHAHFRDSPPAPRDYTYLLLD